MKYALILSLFLNGVLFILLWKRAPEKEIVERVIIETHKELPPPVIQKVSKKVTPTPVIPSKEESKDVPMEFVAMDSHELRESGEKMENDRNDFFLTTLGMSEEKIAARNTAIENFYRETSTIHQELPGQELDIEQRRKLLDKEEKLEKKLESIFGSENWVKYKKYRQDYNRKGFKRQSEDNQPFIFMNQ